MQCHFRLGIRLNLQFLIAGGAIRASLIAPVCGTSECIVPACWYRSAQCGLPPDLSHRAGARPSRSEKAPSGAQQAPRCSANRASSPPWVNMCSHRYKFYLIIKACCPLYLFFKQAVSLTEKVFIVLWSGLPFCVLLLALKLCVSKTWHLFRVCNSYQSIVAGRSYLVWFWALFALLKGQSPLYYRSIYFTPI